jgi:TonB family protein
MANFSTCQKPVWPAADLQAEHTGAVTLAFLIGADGMVIDSNVIKSSGYPGLDEAAQVGIAKCQFKPATVDSKPVMEWMHMQYVWTLR